MRRGRLLAILCVMLPAGLAGAQDFPEDEEPGEKRLDLELTTGHRGVSRFDAEYDIFPLEIGGRLRLVFGNFVVAVGLGGNTEIILDREIDEEEFGFGGETFDGDVRLGLQAFGRAGGTWKGFEFQIGVYAFRPPLNLASDFPPLLGSAYFRFGPRLLYGFVGVLDMVPYARGGFARTGMGVSIDDQAQIELGGAAYPDDGGGVTCSGWIKTGEKTRFLFSGTGLWAEGTSLTSTPFFYLTVGVSLSLE